MVQYVKKTKGVTGKDLLKGSVEELLGNEVYEELQQNLESIVIELGNLRTTLSLLDKEKAEYPPDILSPSVEFGLVKRRLDLEQEIKD